MKIGDIFNLEKTFLLDCDGEEIPVTIRRLPHDWFSVNRLNYTRLLFAYMDILDRQGVKKCVENDLKTEADAKEYIKDFQKIDSAEIEKSLQDYRESVCGLMLKSIKKWGFDDEVNDISIGNLYSAGKAVITKILKEIFEFNEAAIKKK